MEETAFTVKIQSIKTAGANMLSSFGNSFNSFRSSLSKSSVAATAAVASVATKPTAVAEAEASTEPVRRCHEFAFIYLFFNCHIVI